jgi:fucose permease
MTGTQFNLSISILFVGYLTMQLPSNLLITRMRPSLYLGITMLVWGGVCAATAAVQFYGGVALANMFGGLGKILI